MVYENRKCAEVSENKGLKKSSGIAESVALNLPEHEGSGKWRASGEQATDGGLRRGRSRWARKLR